MEIFAASAIIVGSHWVCCRAINHFKSAEHIQCLLACIYSSSRRSLFSLFGGSCNFASATALCLDDMDVVSSVATCIHMTSMQII